MNQPLEAKDFAGGMTNNFLAGPTNKGELFDNLLINNNKKCFTRPGSIIRDSTYSQIPSGVKRIGYIWDHRDQILEQSERHVYFLSGTYQELTGPTGNQALGIGAESNHASVTQWNNHSLIVSDSFCNPIKIYKDAGSVLRVRNAGLPVITAPTVTAGLAGANNYVYAFLYYYTYSVEGVTFEDFGPTVEVQLLNSAAPDANTVNITNIPVIANGATDNWDTTNIKVKIYRSENNLTVLKFIGQVTNGTTVYNDSASDASITDNVVIYTDGDVVDNDPPPPAKFVHIATNDTALYGYVVEGGVQIPNRCRQSVPGDFDSCPGSFFIDFPETVMGISSIQGVYIVFCTQSVWRVDGLFDEQGRGGMSKQKIADKVGTVSNDSIIQTDNALFFAAQQGWYFCDGYSVKKITNHLNTTYPTLVATAAQGRNIFGAFDKIENRIWFAAQQSTSSLDNDSCFILDLTWGVSDECTFTTASNGSSFAPTALLFKNSTMYRADKRGYVFQHNASYFSDPRVDVTTLPSSWAKKTIIYDYKSCAFDFGTSFIRKFVSKMSVVFANLTNLAVQIYSINDDGRSELPLKQIRYVSNLTWGDPELFWGDPTLIWNQLGLIEEKRHFPAQSLRCEYKQIRITNAFSVIIGSDLIGTMTVDATLKTATLTDATKVLPTDVRGYFMAFEDDSYTQTFEIITRNSDTKVTFFDPLNGGPANGTYKWVMRGYRLDELMTMLSYVLHYKMLSPSQKSYHTGDDGENQ